MSSEAGILVRTAENVVAKLKLLLAARSDFSGALTKWYAVSAMKIAEVELCRWLANEKARSTNA